MKPAVVEAMVRTLPAGTVVCPADFVGVTNARNASTQLARLAQKGLLRRVMRGIYFVPASAFEFRDEVDLDDEDAFDDADPLTPPFRIELPERSQQPVATDPIDGPDPLAIAEAIGRSNHWEITPAGPLALYMLGLPGGNPVSTHYASSGPTTSYDLDGQEIRFRHTASRYLSGLAPASRLVAQALAAIGKDAATDATVDSIASHIMQADAERFAKESAQLPPWMADVALRVRDAKERQIREMMQRPRNMSVHLERPTFDSLIDRLREGEA